MNATYNLMKRIIERGIEEKNLDYDDVMEKLDTFYAANRIKKEQYTELSTMAKEGKKA